MEDKEACDFLKSVKTEFEKRKKDGQFNDTDGLIAFLSDMNYNTGLLQLGSVPTRLSGLITAAIQDRSVYLAMKAAIEITEATNNNELTVTEKSFITSMEGLFVLEVSKVSQKKSPNPVQEKKQDSSGSSKIIDFNDVK